MGHNFVFYKIGKGRVGAKESKDTMHPKIVLVYVFKVIYEKNAKYYHDKFCYIKTYNHYVL